MKSCLNCGHLLSGPYCDQCGQKASTHRLSLKHFLSHDLVHGIWHVDKGLLHTLWQMLVRPACFLRDYLAGKRVGAFNVVTLLLIGAGLVIYISDFDESMSENQAALKADDIPKGIKLLYDFLEHYAKWLLLSMIPVFSLVSFLLFRKNKYYFTEHLAVNSYVFATFLFLLLLVGLIFKLPFLAAADERSYDFFLCLLYLPYAYWMFWRPDYSTGGLIWRFIAASLLYCLLTLLLFILVLVVTLKLTGKPS